MVGEMSFFFRLITGNVAFLLLGCDSPNSVTLFGGVVGEWRIDKESRDAPFAGSLALRVMEESRITLAEDYTFTASTIAPGIFCNPINSRVSRDYSGAWSLQKYPGLAYILFYDVQCDSIDHEIDHYTGILRTKNRRTYLRVEADGATGIVSMVKKP